MTGEVTEKVHSSARLCPRTHSAAVFAAHFPRPHCDKTFLRLIETLLRKRTGQKERTDHLEVREIPTFPLFPNKAHPGYTKGKI